MVNNISLSRERYVGFFSDRFFFDCLVGEKGFVLKKYLVPYSPTKSARSGSVTSSAGQPYGPDLLGTSDIGAPVSQQFIYMLFNR